MLHPGSCAVRALYGIPTINQHLYSYMLIHHLLHVIAIVLGSAAPSQVLFLVAETVIEYFVVAFICVTLVDVGYFEVSTRYQERIVGFQHNL